MFIWDFSFSLKEMRVNKPVQNLREKEDYIYFKQKMISFSPIPSTKIPIQGVWPGLPARDIKDKGYWLSSFQYLLFLDWWQQTDF